MMQRKLDLRPQEDTATRKLLSVLADSGETQNGYRIKRVASTVYKMTQAQANDSDSLKVNPRLTQKNRLQGNLRAIVYQPTGKIAIGDRMTRSPRYPQN